jgi:hypothetical protein
VALAGMLVVPESRDGRRVGLDVPGAILGTSGLTALVYAVIRAGEVGWGNRSVLAAFAVAAILLAAFAAAEARSPAPMLPLAFFRQRDFSGAVLLIGLVLFAMFVTFFFLTQLFQLVQQRSALAAGLLIVPTSVAVTISAGIAATLIHSVGPRRLALAMTTGMLVGLAILTRTTESTGTAQIVAALVIFGFGAGLALPALTDTVMAAVPERDAGVGSAVNDVSRQLGGALGVAVIGSYVSRAYHTHLHHLLAGGTVPASVARTAGSSIGVARQAARALPPDVAATVTRAADQAFVTAITSGFKASLVVVGLAFVVAATMVPRRMRPAQYDERPAEPRRTARRSMVASPRSRAVARVWPRSRRASSGARARSPREAHTAAQIGGPRIRVVSRGNPAKFPAAPGS